MTDFTETYDVVVLGSGAAGLTAAVTAQGEGARVAVFEKESRLGGTTAVSGGVVWIPAHTRGPSPDDFPVRDALTYLGAFRDMRLQQDLIEAFVQTGESMLDAVEALTPIRFWISDGYPDYKPELPGGRPDGGRSFNPSPFDFAQLGEWAPRIYAFPSDWSDVGFDAETLARLRRTSLHGRELTDTTRFMGQALIGGLLKPLLDAGTVVRTGARGVELLADGGRVAGVRIREAQRTYDVAARRGVVLATGGFEWDARLVESFLRGPMAAPVSPPGRTGDGLRMAMMLGADLGNMAEAWWATAVKIPNDTIDGQPRSRSIRSERTRPGCIVVNRRGRRFVNEAQDYNAFGGAFHQLDPQTLSYPNRESWMVFDERHLRRYGFLGVPHDAQAPAWFNGSPNLASLAARTGIDPTALEQTVQRWNHNVSQSCSDPDFHRGDSRYDTFWGDGSLPEGPGRTLGTVQEPPFYAVELHVGTIGTKGGPRTTVDGQVRHVSGKVIPGLYAAGNVMASALGGAYPGAGATIGPAMVFGYRAALHATAVEPR